MVKFILKPETSLFFMTAEQIADWFLDLHEYWFNPPNALCHKRDECLCAVRDFLLGHNFAYHDQDIIYVLRKFSESGITDWFDKKSTLPKAPLVLNRYKDQIPLGSVTIMRGTMWGNPYKLEDYDNDRFQVLQLYDAYLTKMLRENEAFRNSFVQLASVPALLCVCKPQDCHGDIMVRKLIDMGLCE